MEFDNSRHVAGQNSGMSGPDGRRPYVAPFLRHLAITATEHKATFASKEEGKSPNGPS